MGNRQQAKWWRRALGRSGPEKEFVTEVASPEGLRQSCRRHQARAVRAGKTGSKDQGRTAQGSSTEKHQRSFDDAQTGTDSGAQEQRLKSWPGGRDADVEALPPTAQALSSPCLAPREGTAAARHSFAEAHKAWLRFGPKVTGA